MFIPVVIREIILDYVEDLQEYTGLKPVLREIREIYRKKIVRATFADPHEDSYTAERAPYFIDDWQRFEKALWQNFGHTSPWYMNELRTRQTLDQFRKRFLLKTQGLKLYPWEVTKRRNDRLGGD